MSEQIDPSQSNQTENHAHGEVQNSQESPISTELLFGCTTGEYYHDIPLVILTPTPLKHSQGLGGIKDEFTGMSTPLSVATEYRPRQ